MSYDTRAFGDFGWRFVNAGEQYRKLDGVSDEEQLMMCGLFKQATMGDCLVEATRRIFDSAICKPEAKSNTVENSQRAEWLKHKGTDTFEAMKMYIEKVRELALVYQERKQEEPVAEAAADKGQSAGKN